MTPPFGFFGFDPRMMFGRPDQQQQQREHVPVRVTAAMQYISRIQETVTDPPDYGEFHASRDPRALNHHEKESYSAALQLVTRYFQGEQYPDSRADTRWSESMPSEPGAYMYFSKAYGQFYLAKAADSGEGAIRLMIFGHEPDKDPSGYWLQIPEGDFFDQAIQACVKK